MESSCGGEPLLLLLLDDWSGEPGGERAGPSGDRERDRAAGPSGERAGPSDEGAAGPSGDLGGHSVISFSFSSLPLAKPFSSSS